LEIRKSTRTTGIVRVYKKTIHKVKQDMEREKAKGKEKEKKKEKKM